MSKSWGERIRIAARAAIADVGWVVQGIVIAYWVSPNTPNPIASNFWVVLGLSVSSNGFIRIYNRIIGDEMAEGQQKLLTKVEALQAAETTFQTQITQQMSALEQKLDQILQGQSQYALYNQKLDTIASTVNNLTNNNLVNEIGQLRHEISLLKASTNGHSRQRNEL